MYWLVNDSRTERKVKRNSLGSIFTNKLGQCGEEGERGKEEKVHRRYLSPEVLADRISYRAHRQSTSQVPRQFLQYNLQVSYLTFLSFFLTLLTSYLHQLHLSSSFHRFTHLFRWLITAIPFDQSPSLPCLRYVGLTAVAIPPLLPLSHHNKAPQRPIMLVVIKSLIGSASLLEDLQSPCPIPSSLHKDIISRALRKGKQSPINLELCFTRPARTNH